MKIAFHTKTDINGNTYFLQLDTDAKTYTTKCQHFTTYGIKTTRKEMRAIIENAKQNGFKEV